jgi:hypothetical protein
VVDFTSSLHSLSVLSANTSEDKTSTSPEHKLASRATQGLKRDSGYDRDGNWAISLRWRAMGGFESLKRGLALETQLMIKRFFFALLEMIEGLCLSLSIFIYISFIHTDCCKSYAGNRMASTG